MRGMKDDVATSHVLPSGAAATSPANIARGTKAQIGQSDARVHTV
jgi:hypothetical protein